LISVANIARLNRAYFSAALGSEKKV